MNEWLKLIEKRRSIRVFSDAPLTEEQIDLLAQAGQFAPSGMNRQTRQITILRDKTRIERLANAIKTDLHREGEYRFFGAGTLMLLSDEAENPLGDADCACALENIFLMATALGLGSCWINQLRSICDAPTIRPLLSDLGIPKSHRVWGIAALGVPGQSREPRTKLCKVHYA